MKMYLYDYIDYVDDILKNSKRINYKKLKNDYLIKINFFQHERLIHLLVTLFYALFTIIFVFLSVKFWLFSVITIALLIFLLFYVIHYFRLENGVQYLYKQYDAIVKECEKRSIIDKFM